MAGAAGFALEASGALDYCRFVSTSREFLVL